MLGPVGSTLAIAGVFGLLERRPRAAAVILTPAVAYLLVMARLKVFFPRNALPLLPIGAIFAAAGFAWVTETATAKLSAYRSGFRARRSWPLGTFGWAVKVLGIVLIGRPRLGTTRPRAPRGPVTADGVLIPIDG